MSHFWEESLPESNWHPPGDDYELPYGWAGKVSYPNIQGFDAHFQMYRDMVEWIETTVKNPKQNVLWSKIGDCIYVQFRKQKDMDWFVLRFGL